MNARWPAAGCKVAIAVFMVLCLSPAGVGPQVAQAEDGHAAKGRVEVTLAGDRVSLSADAPLAEVLTRLREAAGVQTLLEAEAERPVRLEIAEVSRGELMAALAEVTGLELQVIPGAANGAKAPLFVLRKPARTRFRLSGDRTRGWRCPDVFDYALHVLEAGDPQARALRRAFGSLEVRPGVSLVVAPKLRRRVLAEYVRARGAYTAILARAGSKLFLPERLASRNVRVYLDAAGGDYLVEALFASGQEHVGRLIWRVRPRDQRIVELFAGRWRKRVLEGE